MSKEVIAVVRLSAGESGYYDEMSRIHLTQSNPQRDVLAGTNCTQLRRSVKSGRLRLLSGSLGEEKKLELGKKGNKFVAAPVVAPVAPVVAPIIEDIKPAVEETAAPVIEEAAPAIEEAAPVVEEAPVVVEEVVEPVVEEATVVEEAVVEEAAKEGSKKSNRKNK